MTIAAPPKSQIKRWNFTERRTITRYEKSSTTHALIIPTAWAIFVADAHRDNGKLSLCMRKNR
jgi:hypothetical protein